MLELVEYIGDIRYVSLNSSIVEELCLITTLISQRDRFLALALKKLRNSNELIHLFREALEFKNLLKNKLKFVPVKFCYWLNRNYKLNFD